MWRYIGVRLLQAIPLALGLSALLFVLLALAPGDPIDLMIVNNPNVTPADVARLKHAYGLDQPLVVRYGKWLLHTVEGDLGWSLSYQMPVRRLLAERLPNSIVLMSVGLTISLVVAIPLGIYSAFRQYSLVDYAANLGAFAGFSIPLFWFGLIMIYFFAVKLKLLPPGGMQTAAGGRTTPEIVDRLRHLVLPAIVIGLYNMATLTRYMRSSMLEVMHQDYLRTARSKGLGEAQILRRHAARNAMIPIITVLGLTLPVVFGGAPVTETVFAWPGIGQLLVQSVIAGDYVVAMSVMMMFAGLVVVCNLLADVAYGIFDPRIRYS